jgi:hypothetical protein
MMNFQQAVLEEIRSGIHILQGQDNQIVAEAIELYSGIRAELEAQSKKVTDTTLANLAQKITIQSIQKKIGILSKKIDEVTTVVAAIMETPKNRPTKQELRVHRMAMEESMNAMADVNTGLTTAMDQYKFSDSTPLGRQSAVTGHSGTQPYMNPDPAAAFLSPSVSSLRDTETEYSWHRGLRGGAGSEASGRAAGGAAGGTAGGAARGGPPPPPDPPPSDHGGPGGRRMSRRIRRIKELEFAKPIKIKEPKK